MLLSPIQLSKDTYICSHSRLSRSPTVDFHVAANGLTLYTREEGISFLALVLSHQCCNLL